MNVSFVKLVAFSTCISLLSGCFGVTDVAGIINDSTTPSVSIAAPTPSSGDSSSSFIFNITITGADEINLSSSDITVNSTGLSCNSPVVTNGTSSTPSVSISNCTGDGTLSITVNAAIASHSSGKSSPATSESAVATITNSVCPSGYIPVPGNANYGTSDFCVMKYEAKLQYDSDGDSDFSNAVIVDDGNFDDSKDYGTDYDTASERAKYKAISDSGGRPWVNIHRGENGASTGKGALEACQNLNLQMGVSNRYDLISNDEWQTIARNIESQNSGANNNWGVDSYGDTIINRGHSGYNPTQTCDASQEYLATDCYNSGADSSYENKRTHHLSNGEVIWDLAGNAWEWTKDNNTNNYGSSEYFAHLTDSTHSSSYSLSGGTTTTSRTAKSQFGPAGSYAIPYIFNSYHGGLGKLFTGNTGPVLRGGNYVTTAAEAGIFATHLGIAFNKYSTAGFRCVYR
ncbi:MAG: hypothetical protein VX583_05615 [Bdellovibrionota bacterium]